MDLRDNDQPCEHGWVHGFGHWTGDRWCTGGAKVEVQDEIRNVKRIGFDDSVGGGVDVFTNPRTLLLLVREDT